MNLALLLRVQIQADELFHTFRKRCMMNPSAGSGGEPAPVAASNSARHAATSRGAAAVAKVWVRLVLSSASVNAEKAISSRTRR